MEFVVSIEDEWMSDSIDFTFNSTAETMLFATMAKRHSDTDATVTIEVLKGDEEDED